MAASSREGDEEGATTNDAMGNDGAKNHALGRPYGRDRLTQQHGRAPGVVADRPAPRRRLRRPIRSTSTGTGRRGSEGSPRDYRGIMFRARAYADGLEHPRLWGIAGTVSAAPGRGAKARRASSTNDGSGVGKCTVGDR